MQNNQGYEAGRMMAGQGDVADKNRELAGGGKDNDLYMKESE